MITLTPGANSPLPSEHPMFTLTFTGPFDEYASLALLPTDNKRKPTGEPSLPQAGQFWMKRYPRQDRICCAVNLSNLPAGTDQLLLILYTFSAAGPLSELEHARLLFDDYLEFPISLTQHNVSAMIIGAFYRRNTHWKYRALAEGSDHGLVAFGKKIGITLDDANPNRPASTHSSPTDSVRPNNPGYGTGFAVTTTHILTCAHVIEDRHNLAVSSFDGRFQADPVVVDRRNDLALLRVHGAPKLFPPPFRHDTKCALGETVVAVGFPLSGMAGSGVHVTQGGVSALFGLHNDASLLQFTAPIQPGSSGSPLFDSNGAIIGMVIATIPDAQNMNFAVKTSLILSFLDASNVPATTSSLAKHYSTAELTREIQQSLWRVEAS